MFKNVLCSFFLLFSSLCMDRHVWEGALTCVCVHRDQRSTQDIFPIVFTVSGVHCSSEPGGPATSRICSFPHSPGAAGCALLLVLESVGDLHSGPHPCTAGTLPTDPSPQLFTSFFIMEDSSE